MPENKTPHINHIQILRNIQAFGERLKKHKERFGFVSSNNLETNQEKTLVEPEIEQIPKNPKKELSLFINSRGRGYAPHFTWGITSPTTFNNGGNI